jgi:hypothetical protein
MIPLPMIVFDEFRDCAAEVALPDQNQPIEALFLDRSYEPFGVRIRIWCALGRQDGLKAHVAQSEGFFDI